MSSPRRGGLFVGDERLDITREEFVACGIVMVPEL